ncbi:MAG: LLM class flavin-dependent oxidoreductase [Pseudomonadales bacterium]
MSKKIEIATTSWSQNTSGSADEYCQQAELAESLGFHSFWLPENHFGDQRSLPSPLTILAAVAGRTSAIRLATTSYLITIRNPLQAAEEVAVLDRLSNGRLILGLGRGMQSAMFAAFNLPTSEKRKRFKANLDLMIKAWAGEAIAFDGEKPVHLAPLPVQRPHPPLWIAAFGPLALSQAGTLGLPYLASPVETLAVLEKNYAHYHGVVAQHHADAMETIPVMRTVFVSNQNAKIKQVKESLANTDFLNMHEEGTKVDDWTIVGDESYVRDKVAEYKERLGMTHLIVRGRISGLSDQEQTRSHETLLRLTDTM